ncbi:heavy metal translocating P-type ATPase [Desulfosporosinus metallidurans]|uniref:Lead, cadmium, zinc and mercury transporting ATPase n=1 Tax=Desulfosporosinus metallidurans TaxID=1888891 RepID=A0A1Q8QL75_9FIRM|nr:heavy metal translocating P-type ATPase [Desulfosporosinus metallidurans]OLN28018.1 Lead, cadmium, zinc and mercury transporting ATPase [Desulfosporosinus metallidurans]
MSSTVKKELLLEGLDCANCANKIEDQVKRVGGVNSATLNFVTKVLTIELVSDGNKDDILNQANQIINKLEPHIIIKDKALSRPERKVLLLIGLDCANCANKIESEVKNLEGVSSATVDFVSRKLTLEVNNKRDLQRVIEQASKIAVKIESGIKVVEYEDKKEESKEDGGINKPEVIRLAIGAALFFVAILGKFPFWAEFGIFLVSYVLVGGKVVLKAVRNILKGQVFDENFLMTVATIGAFAIKQFPEGVAVMLFYQVGEFFQNMAVNRSRKSISALMDIRPDYANLKVGEDIKRVSPEEISVGDIILIKPGEKVPLDGKVIEGMSMLDTSAITGESVPREVEPGNEILSGTINKNGLLTVEVTKEFGDSTVSKILDLVQNANSKKAPTEQFITKFSRYYTPVVVFVALAMAVIPPLVVTGATFSDWIYRALVFLVVSCPCALVISIPLGFFGGIGGAAKSGILVKGSNFLEALNNVDTIVFDKTGTLTKGVFKVTKIHTLGRESEENLLEYAAFAESYSSHPIATSILKAYGKEINKSEIENYDEISGHGIKVSVKGKRILAGNKKLMNKENITYNVMDETGTVVHIAIDGNYAGYIVISDEIKDDAEKAVRELRGIGVKKLVMLTGDSKLVGETISRQLGLDEVHAELLPDQKVEKLELLEKQKQTKGKLLFVGDGINDAPVLARADLGVAMGGLGSDAAIEAADIVIMTDEPSKLVNAIKIAKRTRSIVWQNIFFALGVKAVVLVLGAGGIATIWEAVFADVGVTVIAVINAMRVMKTN